MFGAEVLWPLDCPDDILESTIKELKMLENDQKLALDKDGLKVLSNANLDCRTPEKIFGLKLRTVLACVFGEQFRMSCDARKK